jgi:hypothetical protein
MFTQNHSEVTHLVRNYTFLWNWKLDLTQRSATINSIWLPTFHSEERMPQKNHNKLQGSFRGRKSKWIWYHKHNYLANKFENLFSEQLKAQQKWTHTFLWEKTTFENFLTSYTSKISFISANISFAFIHISGRW